jgi:hypothetical protein
MIELFVIKRSCLQYMICLVVDKSTPGIDGKGEGARLEIRFIINGFYLNCRRGGGGGGGGAECIPQAN